MEVGGGICDECFDSCNFGTSCIIARRTVAERDCLITEISPGRRGGGAGKELGRNTHDSEERVLGRGENRSEEFLNIINCKMRVTPGA